MVLRPHILRYKGKLRKVDAEKMKKIKLQETTLKEELTKTKAIPKMNFFVIFAGMFVFSSNPYSSSLTRLVPLMYYRYMKNLASETVLETDSGHRERERNEGDLLLEMDS